MKKAFTKNKLIAGKHIVKTHDDNIGIVLKDNNGEVFIQFQYDFDIVSLYEDDLSNKVEKGWSIDAVYEINTCFNIFVLNKTKDEYFDEYFMKYVKLVWSRY